LDDLPLVGLKIEFVIVTEIEFLILITKILDIYLITYHA